MTTGRPLPRGPRGLGAGTLRAIRRDPLAFFGELPRRYGDAVRFRLGPYTWVALNDPALVEQVLVGDAAGYTKGVALARARFLLGDGLLTSEDPLHARQRRLAAPAFAPRRVSAYAGTMTSLAAASADRWRDGEVVDVAAEMTRLTLSVVVAALFGADLAADDAATVGRSLTEILDVFDGIVSHPLGPLLQRLPTRRTRRLAAARSRLDAVVERLVAARRGAPDGRADLLAALLAAHDGGGGIDAALLRDELMTVVLAGHETTTSWLAFAWLALAEHPEVEARLHAELSSVLGGRPPGADDVARLPYAGAVLEEALRLYPPVWGIGRRARSERALGPYVVPAGAVISICQHVLHRDPRVFDDPLRYTPERWLGPGRATPARGGYIPFADGPRVCIGEHFARAEAVLVLATIAQRVHLARVDAAPVALDARVTLRPRGGLPLRVTQRR